MPSCTQGPPWLLVDNLPCPSPSLLLLATFLALSTPGFLCKSLRRTSFPQLTPLLPERHVTPRRRAAPLPQPDSHRLTPSPSPQSSHHSPLTDGLEVPLSAAGRSHLCWEPLHLLGCCLKPYLHETKRLQKARTGTEVSFIPDQDNR